MTNLHVHPSLLTTKYMNMQSNKTQKTTQLYEIRRHN